MRSQHPTARRRGGFRQGIRNRLGDPTGDHRSRRRASLVAVAFVALAAVVTVPVAVGALTSPQTKLNQPASGADVSGDVVVKGWARHPKGVASVELAFRNLDDDTYWNGNRWQSGFVRFSTTVAEPGARSTSWSTTIAAAQLKPGHYRARAFARSVEGNGDSSGGDYHDFTYQLDPDVPPTTVPATTVPSTTVPSTTVPSTTVPPTTVPPTTVPATTVPPTTVPATTVPATTVPATTVPPGCSQARPAILVPCRGVMIGATGDHTKPDGSPIASADDFAATESLLGAKLDIYHEYLQWNELVAKPWPSDRSRALADQGHILLTNWKSPTGRPQDWASVADGTYDPDIAAAARQVAAFGRPTFIAFFHEAEDDIKTAANGDPALEQRYIGDYRQAFRHLHKVFVANGATNAVWVWNVQGWLGGWQPYYQGGLYPGDDVVDWIAWDPYNWFGCASNSNAGTWRSFTQTVAPFYDWLNQGVAGRPSADKPLMLAELGSQENTGAANSTESKAGWLNEAEQVLPSRFPRLRAVVYFNTEGRRPDGSLQFCAWGLDTSPSATAAMRSLVLDPSLDPVWP